MQLTARQLLTIISEAALENTLLRDIEELGATGYTITDARGKGGKRGLRDATWAPHANIRLEVLCDVEVAHAIWSALHERYYDNYSMVMYLSEVNVLRPEKF
ncbi:MAG: transcriptional regulator [Rubrivivax sp.]|nr:transcriptional regulator [Rubrivivax sp.]